MTDNELIKAKNIIRNLHSYCFLTQSSYRQMGYKFCERDFEILHDLTDNFYSQKAEIERVKTELSKLKETFGEDALQNGDVRYLELYYAIKRITDTIE